MNYEMSFLFLLINKHLKITRIYIRINNYKKMNFTTIVIILTVYDKKNKLI